MAAVIRVKRRLDEEPLDALVVNCKKRKVNEQNVETPEDQLSTVWTFAGTLNSQEEDVFKHIKKPTKSEAEEQYKKHVVNLNEKVRRDVRAASRSNRLKVVNCFRSNNSENQAAESTSTAEENKITIVDVESNEVKENEPQVDERSNPEYVYDLYYTNSDDFGEIDLNEFVSIHPLSEELIYGTARDNGLVDLDSDDSEDSNAENNWRNDYPDESDMESITEDDMVEAMNKVDVNDLSSDDGEEGFVYSIDSEAAGFEEDVDLSDVRRYGEMYARFKARNKNVSSSPPPSNFYYGDIDEEEYYY